MRRSRRATTETAGFYNTVGFNDDTRAFLSIPARHDVARRIDCGFLAAAMRRRHDAKAPGLNLLSGPARNAIVVDLPPKRIVRLPSRPGQSTSRLGRPAQARMKPHNNMATPAFL